jgi:hypothetical protein
MFYDTHEHVTTYDDAKYLCVSSLLFLIPSIYALINHLYIISIILFFTSIISFNYWKKPTISWRRDLDLIFSKISFVIFFVLGIIYVKFNYSNLPYYFGIIIIKLCYYISNHVRNVNYWYIYHMIFHITMFIELMKIINSIIYY